MFTCLQKTAIALKTMLSDINDVDTPQKKCDHSENENFDEIFSTKNMIFKNINFGKIKIKLTFFEK